MEHSEARASSVFFAAALIIWGAGLAVQRLRPHAAVVTRPPWQRVFTELPADAQAEFRSLREGVVEAENRREETQTWPEVDALASDDVPPFANEAGWELRKAKLLASYVRLPKEASADRWLVLFIEPDPRLANEVPPPDDEEHHTLPSGLALHVTVWVQPNRGEVPQGVLAFPATEGWVQVVGR